MLLDQKGGMKGGHAIAVSTQFSQHKHVPAHNNNEPPLLDQVPKGLTNVGNTCYANAALQCLLSTALTNALLDPQIVPLFRRYSSNPNLLAQGSGSVDSEEEEDIIDPDSPKQPSDPPALGGSIEDELRRRKEREEKKMQENCQWLTRELTTITQEYVEPVEPVKDNSSSSYMSWFTPAPQPPENVVDPGSVTRHPDRLSKCLNRYQQEDAHEFMRALLATLVMNGHNKQLSSLFDGLLESAVTCQTCGRTSLTRDRYMDLSLDINEHLINTLEDALYAFTKTETLDGDNAYRCQKCDRKRKVTKGLRLATAPSILVCHLKRFAFDRFGRLVRLPKKIRFPERLQIGDFMSHLNKARPPPYDLVGILVHQGSTCASGHYLAFVKKNGEWYKCNDSVVTKVDKAIVFDQQAYILMYEVAEMRERTGCTPRSRSSKTLPAPFVDDDVAEISKDGTDGYSMDARASLHSDSSAGYAQQPFQRILKFLNEGEGVSGFFTEMCCDSDAMNEPQTHELKRKNKLRSDEDTCTDTGEVQPMSRSLSNAGFRVIEVPKRKGRGVRSRTAPRQRIATNDFSLTGFDMDSPRTTFSTNSDGKARKRSSMSHSSHTRHSSAEERTDNGRSRSRTVQNISTNGDLPPLPRQQRAKSIVTDRKKDGVMT